MKMALNTAALLVASMMTAWATPGANEVPISGNAALRYWAAFSEVHDSDVSAQQAKELNSVLDDTAPYDDSKYQDLVKKNQLALEIMSRGTRLRLCDWGLDYELGLNTPVEYAREALMWGRLNRAPHISPAEGRQHGRIGTGTVAGLRFSHDVGNGGTLFAALVAKSLLADHLRAIADVLRLGQLSADQDSLLQTSIAALNQGLDWSTAAKRELELLRRDYAPSPRAASALNRVITTYIAAVGDPSNRATAEQAIKEAPKDLANIIPNLGGVLKAKQDLSDAIRQTLAALR